MSRAATRGVRGAGGKGGGGGATESPDTLQSTQYADVVDLLSEGEVEGLVNGLQSYYLDGVPLQNGDGTFNFDGVQVTFTPGTQGQSAITGADGIQNETAVGVDVLATTPVVRTITNPSVDTVRVTIAVPQLSETNTSNGDVHGSSFQWSVEVQSAGGGFVEVLRDTVEGKTGSRYTRSKVFSLTGSAPWDIRVKRLTADSGSSYTVNKFSWASFTQIQSLKLRHPNSAMTRLRINAQQFSRIPTRAWDLMGLRVQVPSNYDPKAKTYTGVWDGTFKMAWTDCPAWVYYAMLTHPRYGLGRYFATGESLKWSLYTIGRRCDEMVPDGKGGHEPRFRCGVVLQTREQAFRVLSDLAAIFAGMAYWGSSDVAVVQDAPSDPVVLYTPANVVHLGPGKYFTYAGVSRTTRHTQWTTWFNDLSQMGKLVPETVVDAELERKLGVRPMELSPLGIWSRGQAQRVAKWAQYSERYEGRTVTLRVGLDGVLAAPGRIFAVADPHEAGQRLGGRVRSATVSQVTLDAPVTLVAGEGYSLLVTLPDPADPARLITQERAVSPGVGPTQVLNVAPPLDAAPAPGTIWVLKPYQVQPTLWRCLVCKPLDDNQFELTGLRHYPEKWDDVEGGVSFQPPPVSQITPTPPAPENMTLAAATYRIGLADRIRLAMSWDAPAPGLTYAVRWRLGGGAWTTLPVTSSNAVDIDGLAPGQVDVAVQSINALGNRSVALEDSLALTGTPAAMHLTATAFAFAYDATGAPKPAGQSIGFFAQPVSLVGAVTWTAKGYNASGVLLGDLTLTGSDSLRSLTNAAFGASAYAVVSASIGAYSEQVIISRFADGAPGAPGSNGQNVARVRIYQRAATTPALPSATVTFTFATGDVAGLNNGWSATIPSGTSPLYVTEASAVSAGATDTIAAGEWATPVVMAQNGTNGTNGTNGANGADGINSATVFLYQRNNTGTPPAVPAGSLTYTFATGVLSGTLGSWTQTVPAASGGKYLYVTTATALSTTATDAIATGEWAAVRTMAQDGAAGANAAGMLTNGDFETGTLVGWQSVEGTLITGDAYFGTYSMRIPVGSGGPNVISNSWPVAPGSVYTLGCFVKRDEANLPTSNFSLGVRCWNASGTQLDRYGVAAASATVAGWQALSGDFTVPAGAVRMSLDLGEASGTSGYWIADAASAVARGIDGASGQNVARVRIYQRAAAAPAVPSATVTFTFATGGISGLNNGWSATIPTGSNPLYVTEASAVSADATDTIAAGEWAAPVVLVQNGADGTNGTNGANGANGLNSATVFLYQRNNTGTPPAVPSASLTYTFATGLLSGTLGSWTQTVPAASGGKYLYVTTATALSATATDAIATGEWAAVRTMAQDGDPGSVGNLLQNSDFAGLVLTPWAIGYVENGGSNITTQVDLAGSSYVPAGGHQAGVRRFGNALTGAVDFGHAKRIPVEGGKVYELSAYLVSIRGDCDIAVSWRKMVSGVETVITDTHFAPASRGTGGQSLANWPRAGGLVTAPADAQLAMVYMHTMAVDSGQTDAYYFLTRAFFGQALPGQTALSPWAPGPQVSGSDDIANNAATETYVIQGTIGYSNIT